MDKKEIAIVYMVAGISSRFGGKIKSFAKVGKNNETLMEISLNQALKSGFSKIIFIVGETTIKPFKDKFNDKYKGVPVFYALQTFDKLKREKPWGTSDAIITLKGLIDCPFVVCNGDDIYGEKTFRMLFNHLRDSNEEASIGYRLMDHLPDTAPANRGIFKLKDDYVISIKEHMGVIKTNLSKTNNTPDDLCSSNIFALHPKVIDYLKDLVDDFKKQNQSETKKEALLPDMLSTLIKENKIKMKIYPAIEGIYGLTIPEDEEILRKKLAGL